MSTDREQAIMGAPTPGRLLAAAREQCAMTQVDIARRMRLSVQTIKDIEADDYQHIRVRTFVRGYLCGYAKLVRLSEVQISESFELMGAFPQEAVTVVAEPAPVVAEAKAQWLAPMVRKLAILGLALLSIVVIALIVSRLWS